ncbi:MAG: 6-bladed beta-propeller, partial [Anaerolineae bacterium]
LVFMLLPAAALAQRFLGRTELAESERALQNLTLLVGTLALPLTSGLLLELSGLGPAEYTPEGLRAAGSEAVAAAATIVAVLVGVSVVIGLLWNRRRFLISLGLFYGIFLLLHTTFLTNIAGTVTGLVGSLGYWLSQHDVRRGTQPAYYYFLLIPIYEFLPVALALLAGVGYFLRRRLVPVKRNPEAIQIKALFVPWLLFWIAGAFAIYSWAGEKMPWLSIHLTLPIVLLAGYGFDRIWKATDWSRLARPQSGLMAAVMLAAVLVGLGALTAPSSVEGMIDIGTELEALRSRLQQLGFVLLLVGLLVLAFRIGVGLGRRRVTQIAGYSLLGLATLFTVRYAVLASYIHGDVAREILIYTQTSPDVTLVVGEIEDLSERLVGGNDMPVAFDEFTSWPFLWYLRDFPNQQFFGRELFATPEAPVVLVGLENEPGVRPFLSDYIRQEYPLRWWFPEDYRVQEGAGWLGRAVARFTQTFTTPELRSSLMRFLLYRDLERPLGSSDFAFYLRRDVASQLWRSSAVPLTPDLVADPYEERRIEVTSLLTWGELGQSEGEFNQPRDLDFDTEGNLYIADSLNHRIQVFDPDGGFIREWGGAGSGPGEFTEPWGVAVDREAGRIYVADTWNHRVQVFTLLGRFINAWGFHNDSRDVAGADPLGFFGPRDVAVDANGDVWVTDTGNKRLVKFAPDGTPLGQWGGGGPAAGEFQEPVGIALDESGRIYVADTWNRRIQVFDSDFNPLGQWHLRAWTGEAPANKPFLAVNAAGQVFATDPEGYRVLVLSGEGELLAVFGHFGDDEGSFNVPTGLVVDATGALFVADSG